MPAPKKRRVSSGDNSEGDAVSPVAKPAKKTKTANAPDGQDDEGNPFWELSSKRRVGVSQFKNTCLVNLREYYEKDGKMLPGKKGIALSVDQYAALLKAAPAINATLRELGQTVNFPDEPIEAAATTSKTSKTKASKANIEATSDEDEG